MAEYRLYTGIEPDSETAVDLDVEKNIIHTAATLGEMVEFITNDDRFGDAPFSADEEAKFREHGQYGWYEDGPGVLGTPYIVERVGDGE